MDVRTQQNTRLTMNEDAELYHNSNNLQRTAAVQCLEDYCPRMKWMESGDRVIDIGSGDGYVTDAIKKFMPNTFAKLVGCDRIKNMVKFANEHFEDERTSFTLLDIADDLPEAMMETFDHAFSFFALHWIQNQEKAFTNIYKLLSDEGDCLLSFLGRMPLYTAFTKLSETKRWSKWLRNIEQFVSPYHEIEEPDKQITEMLKKIGFQKFDIRCKQKIYKYRSIKELRDAIMAVNPFKMPKEVLDDFLEDYVRVVRGMNVMDHTNNDSDTITVHYNLIVVYASKS